MIFLKKIKIFFSNHYLAVGLALIVGFMAVAPELLAIINLGADYQDIPFFSANDNLFYAAKIQDILDGHWRANSPAFYEYKSAPSLILPFGEYFYAWPAIIFGLSLAKILLINKFILTAVLFFLIYLLVYELGGRGRLMANKINAIAAGLLATLGYDLVNIKGSWLLITGQIHNYVSLGWARPVNPVTGGILLFLFLLLIWRLINYRKKYLAFFVGLILSFMLFYFFSWGAGLAVVGVLLLICLIRKDFGGAGYLFAAVIISLLASAYYWLDLWRTFGSPDGRATAFKSGLLLMHQPLFNKVLLIGILIYSPCLIYAYRQKKRENQKLEDWWWYGLALLLGGLLALNQQLVTGRTVWPYHFVQYTIPFAIIALLSLFYNFLRSKSELAWRFVVFAIIFSSLAWGVASVRSSVYARESFGELQKYAPALNWFNENAAADCVVFTREKPENLHLPLSSLIPAITHCNVYNPAWLVLGMVPEERVRHNYFISLKLKGVGGAGIDDYLSSHQDEVRGIFFKDIAMANAKSINHNDPYVLDTIKEIAPAYREFLSQDFAQTLKKYRLDFIASEGELSEENKKLFAGISLISEFNGIYIYKY